MFKIFCSHLQDGWPLMADHRPLKLWGSNFKS